MRAFFLFMLILLAQSPVSSFGAAIHNAAKEGDISAITAALEAGADAPETLIAAMPKFLK